MAQVRCSVLLELPNRELEAAFWRHRRTIRAYTMWDMYVCINLLIFNLLIVKAMAHVLLDSAMLRHAWHIHLNLLLVYTSCPAILALALRRPAFYSRHRHKIAVASRLARLACMAAAAWQSSEVLQGVLGAAMPAMTRARSDDARSQLYAAVLTVNKPLLLPPLITMAQGNWVFAAKYYVPLQLLTHALAVHGAQRHLPCRMASDAASAVLLQPTCKAMTQLHKAVAGSLFGATFLYTLPFGTTDDPPACADAITSARSLVWYTQAAYGVLMPLAGFFALEWRLKVAFVRRRLRKHLAYGPCGWPRSPDITAAKSRVQQSVAWVVVIAASLWVLWYLALLVVPRLPWLPCETCADKGTCITYAPCDGLLCESPGLYLAVLTYSGMLFCLIGHLIVIRWIA